MNGHPQGLLKGKKGPTKDVDGEHHTRESTELGTESAPQPMDEMADNTQDPPTASDARTHEENRATGETPQPSTPQKERNPTPESHFIGEDGDAEEEGRRWGHPIILPIREGENSMGTHTPWGNGPDNPTTQATGWLRGLELMDQICPRTWANHGVRAGRRIPTDFRAPYCTILTNICQHHDEAVCRGWTVKQRRLEKLLLCIQGMLHRLETKEGEELDSQKAAAERARQLHTRYRTFTTGGFTSILEQDNVKGDKNPLKPTSPEQEAWW